MGSGYWLVRARDIRNTEPNHNRHGMVVLEGAEEHVYQERGREMSLLGRIRKALKRKKRRGRGSRPRKARYYSSAVLETILETGRMRTRERIPLTRGEIQAELAKRKRRNRHEYT